MIGNIRDNKSIWAVFIRHIVAISLGNDTQALDNENDKNQKII